MLNSVSRSVICSLLLTRTLLVLEELLSALFRPLNKRNKVRVTRPTLARSRNTAQKIEKELHDISADVLNVLDHHLLPNAQSDEATVFYFKMKGDYYRYMAEFTADTKRKDAGEKSLEAYKRALQVAETKLPTTHPIRLGLALNFSVFYFEILNEPTKACDLAKKAFDEAIKDLDNLTEDSYKDSTVIMQLLRDNLTLWTSGDDNEAEGDGEDDDAN